MPITPDEANQIRGIIAPIIDQVVEDYDFDKYPAESYEQFKNEFSQLNENNRLVELSLKWKWGHWGKNNYPRKQQDLAAEVQDQWTNYVNENNNPTSEQTFMWWTNVFNRNTTYISAAYITHLVHFNEPLPIIDQHNYRAMNALKSQVRENHQYKKKPSNWNDIVLLKQFMQSILHQFPGRSFGELDRFLMMYGRNHAPR